MGERQLAELAFDDVEVPAENRLGEEGSGFVPLMQNFQNERLALAVMGHATAEIVLDDAIAYAKERKAFGRTLAGFQVTRHKLAEMAGAFTQVAVAKSFNYDLARQRHARRVPSSARPAWRRISRPG